MAAEEKKVHYSFKELVNYIGAAERSKLRYGFKPADELMNGCKDIRNYTNGKEVKSPSPIDKELDKLFKEEGPARTMIYTLEDRIRISISFRKSYMNIEYIFTLNDQERAEAYNPSLKFKPDNSSSYIKDLTSEDNKDDEMAKCIVQSDLQYPLRDILFEVLTSQKIIQPKKIPFSLARIVTINETMIENFKKAQESLEEKGTQRSRKEEKPNN